MEKGLLDTNLKKTIELYRERRTLMISCFKKYMPEGVTWTEPHGGLFLFVTLPGHIHSELIFKKAIDKNGGNISKAAKELGLTRASLYRRLEKYGL